MAIPNASPAQVLKNLNNPWKMGFYLFKKLPSAFFMGIRVKSVNETRAQITLPYHWRSQNPFRSIYFAAQCAAGEMSTGVLCLYALAGKGNVSMLVTHVESSFYKKANQLTTFTCEEGMLVQETIQRVVQTGEAQTITMTSTGTMPDGEIVSVIKITWSFKKRIRD